MQADPMSWPDSASRAALQTDDRMSLEFTAARAMYAPPSGSAGRVRALARGRPSPARSGSNAERARRRLERERCPPRCAPMRSTWRMTAFDGPWPSTAGSTDALRGSTEAAAGTDSLAAQTEWLETLAAAEPHNAGVRVELSHVLAALGRTEEAIAAAESAARIDPASPEAAGTAGLDSGGSRRCRAAGADRRCTDHAVSCAR